jgi:UDP-N-acetylmuramoyl-L-alanyl-D-glutamate--2,6-diaminopimelate ligase
MNVKLPEIYPVTSHTDHVGPNTTFVVVQGMKEDGSRYIPVALSKGARTIVVDRAAILTPDIEQLIAQHGAILQRVENPRLALAQLSAQAWGHPAQKLKIVGVTGTKGKTTTSFILAHMLQHAGYKTALLSSVHNAIGSEIYETELTTQHPDYLHMFLAQCVLVGVEYVVMEVAAQGLSLSRVAGIPFHAAVFTNFSQEHGEFYSNLEDYFAAKCALFAQVASPERIFVNADDSWGTRILSQNEFSSFTLQGAGKNAAQLIKSDSEGILLQVRGTQFKCPSLIGRHNAYNVLSAFLVATSCGVPMDAIHTALHSFVGAPGRLERYSLPNGAVGVIDHAHNPSSFKAILPVLRELSPKLIAVFGCGGERESARRPIMGQIAAEIADLIILTTDNPRSEDPAAIIQEIMVGIPQALRHKVIVELDRQKAIALAYAHADKQAIIALLGKGPEQYQAVGTDKIPFSERAILQSLS